MRHPRHTRHLTLFQAIIYELPPCTGQYLNSPSRLILFKIVSLCFGASLLTLGAGLTLEASFYVANQSTNGWFMPGQAPVRDWRHRLGTFLEFCGEEWASRCYTSWLLLAGSLSTSYVSACCLQRTWHDPTIYDDEEEEDKLLGNFIDEGPVSKENVSDLGFKSADPRYDVHITPPAMSATLLRPLEHDLSSKRNATSEATRDTSATSDTPHGYSTKDGKASMESTHVLRNPTRGLCLVIGQGPERFRHWYGLCQDKLHQLWQLLRTPFDTIMDLLNHETFTVFDPATLDPELSIVEAQHAYQEALALREFICERDARRLRKVQQQKRRNHKEAFMKQQLKLLKEIQDEEISKAEAHNALREKISALHRQTLLDRAMAHMMG